MYVGMIKTANAVTDGLSSARKAAGEYWDLVSGNRMRRWSDLVDGLVSDGRLLPGQASRLFPERAAEHSGLYDDFRKLHNRQVLFGPEAFKDEASLALFDRMRKNNSLADTLGYDGGKMGHYALMHEWLDGGIDALGGTGVPLPKIDARRTRNARIATALGLGVPAAAGAAYYALKGD